ncbi:MAG TPA: sigma 54-interacting transcriptional regulator, partial [Polyangiales bacterium]|nr:sigma 54-interacting transcriptional regulator [Polyangiales bacterium]
MSAELRLLIVDGDQTSLVELARGLAQLGWEVVCEAQLPRVRQLLREQPCVAILAELQWTELDGTALMQELRELAPEACLLAASDRLDVGATVSAMRAGADDVLEKPLAVHLVDERLRQALERRRGPLASATREDAASNVLGETPGIRTVREQIRTVARFRDLPVMIMGETGTGKELIAQAIHALSDNHGPFVPVNCSAIPEALFESELFGHEAGAFTGARGARAGLFETAGSGTLLLDELGEMPSLLQPKLLRAIEARTFRRIGGNKDLPFRARIVSATHRKIGGKDSLVRSDLYYRLAGFTITTP